MTALPLGLASYERTGLPEVRLENLYPESTPTSSTGAALLTVPGMALYATRGNGPMRGGYQQDGVFSGDLFVVSGGELYRGASVVGPIAGTDDVEFAARGGRLYILGGGVIHEYNGGALSAMSFPDDALVSSIADINGILLAGRQGTGRFYFMLSVDSAWQALDYQTAEREEDPLLAIRTTADEVWMFGSTSVEPFYPTGNADQPFQRADGRSYALGCRDRDTAQLFDNGVVWVDEQGRVVKDGTVISNFGIAERIRRATGLRAFTFGWDGHEFYALEIGGEGTFLYDAATGEWHDRKSYERSTWLARCAVQVGATVYLGSAVDGKIYTLSASQLTDDGDPLIKVFTCAVPALGAGRMSNLVLNCSVGNAEDEPFIQLRWSDDQGLSWTEWQEVGLGAQGEYRTRPAWRALGMVDFPGRVLEFRCPDAVKLRVSAADYNAPMGGRSR